MPKGNKKAYSYHKRRRHSDKRGKSRRKKKSKTNKAGKKALNQLKSQNTKRLHSMSGQGGVRPLVESNGFTSEKNKKIKKNKRKL